MELAWVQAVDSLGCVGTLEKTGEAKKLLGAFCVMIQEQKAELTTQHS